MERDKLRAEAGEAMEEEAMEEVGRERGRGGGMGMLFSACEDASRVSTFHSVNY